MNKNILIEIQNLKIVFEIEGGKQVCVVEDVDLCLKEGEILGIVGESGSGKTQSALAILGIELQEPGIVNGILKITVGNERCEFYTELVDKYVRKLPNGRYKKNNRKWRREIKNEYSLYKIRGKKIFLMFQDPRSYLNPFWTIRKHFECLAPDSPLIEINDCLLKFNLDPSEVLDAYPCSLSGGQCQRVMITLGYILKPEVIIADEITTGLDLINQVAVVRSLNELKEKQKLSIILISHDIGFVGQLADKILIMYDGQGAEFGPAKNILDIAYDIKHPYTSELLKIFKDKHNLGYIDHPPRKNEIITGCRFHRRCALRETACEYEAPRDFGLMINEDHQLRCKKFQSSKEQ